MKKCLAVLFRLLFRIQFIKKRHFGIHERLFKPYNLFKGVIFKTNYNGLQVILRIEDWIQENIFFLGEYEKAELKAIERFVTGDGIFIDIGANIGLYTLHVSKLTNHKTPIICFEPFYKNYFSLIENITLNRLSNVTIEKIAIGEKEGVINLYYDKKENNLGMVSLNPVVNAIKEEVQITSLDAYLINKSFLKIDLIKIDIEGFEYEALLGMKYTLTTFQPTLLIEMLDSNKSCGQNLNCDNLLKGIGYSKYFIDNDGGLSINNVNNKRMNYLFTTKIFPDLM
jgi:FkbM family methyltransferase